PLRGKLLCSGAVSFFPVCHACATLACATSSWLFLSSPSLNGAGCSPNPSKTSAVSSPISLSSHGPRRLIWRHELTRLSLKQWHAIVQPKPRDEASSLSRRIWVTGKCSLLFSPPFSRPSPTSLARWITLFSSVTPRAPAAVSATV